jgi:hypothetical protein
VNTVTKSKQANGSARPLLMSLPEARRDLGGISRSSLYVLFREGKLPLRKIGGCSFVLTSDLDVFIKGLPVVNLNIDLE